MSRIHIARVTLKEERVYISTSRRENRVLKILINPKGVNIGEKEGKKSRQMESKM